MTGARSQADSAPRRAERVVRITADVGEDVRRALAYLLRSTDARPQTEAEVRSKLLGRDFDEETVDEALRHARALRAVDDEAFARAWVEQRGLERGYGVARVRQELRRRLVPEPLIDYALAALEVRDDHSAAAELARRRLAQLPSSLAPEALVRRLTAYLVRRGHPPTLAQRVAIEISGIDRDWD